MSDYKLIKQFVDSFQRLDQDLVTCEDVPLEMIVKRDCEDWESWKEELAWQPRRVETGRGELGSLYSRIHGKFPVFYEQLILTYRWLEVDLRVARLFANPPGAEFTGLEEKIFSDPVFSAVLVPAGFVPFARSAISYDPICFDLNAMTPQRDCPIVEFEHEAILCRSEIGESQQRWKSFREFMAEIIFMEAE